MKIDLDDMIVKFKHEISDKLIENWIWLIGKNKKAILISAIGDMFLTSDNGSIFWLDVGLGKLEMVAVSSEEFEKNLTDVELVNKWFMVDLTRELRHSGKRLEDGQVYSYKKLPVIGGEYTVDNFETTELEVHFCFAGQIHGQIKDLPEGTKINEVYDAV